MTQTNEQIQALQAAAEKATQGEWCIDDHCGVIADSGLNANFYIASCSGPDHRQNKRFIAAANPAAILSLLAERDADKALIAEQTKYIERLREWNAGLAQESLDHQQRITDTDDALCKLLPGVQYMDQPDGGNVTPLEQVSRMVADYRQQIAELSSHLRNAHAFIENTEAFGGEAATGIIKCGDAEWNIDASKAALINSPTFTVKLPLESLPKTEAFWSVMYDLMYQTKRKPHENWNVSLAFSEAKELAAYLNEVMPFRDAAGITLVVGE